MTEAMTGNAIAQPPFGCFQIFSMVVMEAAASQTARASSGVRSHSVSTAFRRPRGQRTSQ